MNERTSKIYIKIGACPAPNQPNPKLAASEAPVLQFPAWMERERERSGLRRGEDKGLSSSLAVETPAERAQANSFLL